MSDLDRAVAFYRDIVGLTPGLELPERGAAFFWLGSRGEAMLGLWAIGSAPVALALHIGLKASLADILDASERLRSVGVIPLSFF
ncbi:MAG TPA: VOC family protein, partial [Gaiellaceae bacterium]|nr:VOC family protein [Gaiellaceae bacterium]